MSPQFIGAIFLLSRFLVSIDSRIVFPQVPVTIDRDKLIPEECKRSF